MKTCSLAPLVFAQLHVGHDLHDSGVYSIAYLTVVIVITHHILQTQLTHVSSCSSCVMKQGIGQYIDQYGEMAAFPSSLQRTYVDMTTDALVPPHHLDQTLGLNSICVDP